jgi:hypothetical protein
MGQATKERRDAKDQPQRSAIEHHDRFGFRNTFVQRDPFRDWDHRTDAHKPKVDTAGGSGLLTRPRR